MKLFLSISMGLFACAHLAACAPQLEAAQPQATEESASDADHLIAALKTLKSDGFPEDHFNLAELKEATAANDAALTRARAEDLFKTAAREINAGLVAPASRRGWRMDDSLLDEEQLEELAAQALRNKNVEDALASLAPKHEQYALLKKALESGELDGEQKTRIRLNMDRWRWMPNDLGADYILVNAPAFEAMLVRNGVVVDRRRIIAGTPSLPTPQFSAIVTGVIFNPTWFVPRSIVAESVGALMKNDPERAKRLGYYLDEDGGVRQKPGPANALGQMKLVMPNRYSVFMHDTPAKDAFNRDSRALSHGCIRVEGAVAFAQTLLGDAAEENDIPGILAARKGTEIPLEEPLPVYITYLTAFAQADGAVTFYPDVYGLDAPLLADFGGPQEGASPQAEPSATEGCDAREVGAP